MYCFILPSFSLCAHTVLTTGLMACLISHPTSHSSFHKGIEDDRKVGEGSISGGSCNGEVKEVRHRRGEEYKNGKKVKGRSFRVTRSCCLDRKRKKWDGEEGVDKIKA